MYSERHYGIYERRLDGTCVRLTSDVIEAQCEALGLTSEARAIRELERRGLRYSNEDFDVLQAAVSAIWRATQDTTTA